MSVRKSQSSKWTHEETARLRELRKTLSSATEISRSFPKRTRAAVCDKLQCLGLGYPASAIWSEAEYLAVHELWGRGCGDETISMRMEDMGFTRTAEAIRMKRTELGWVRETSRRKLLTPETVIPCLPNSHLYYRMAASSAHLIDLRRAGHIASQYELHIPDDCRAPIKFSGSATDQSYCGSPAAMCAV